MGMWMHLVLGALMMGDPLLEELAQRDLAARSSAHSDPVIQRALGLVGQGLNPIQVVGVPDIEQIYRESAPGAVGSDGARRRLGFVMALRRPDDQIDPNIYVNKEAPAYKTARNPKDALAGLKLASILLHEQIHNTDDERTARIKQADFFRSRMGSLPQSQRAEAAEYLRVLDQSLPAPPPDKQALVSMMKKQ